MRTGAQLALVRLHTVRCSVDDHQAPEQLRRCITRPAPVNTPAAFFS